MKVDYSDPAFLRFMTENIEKTQEKRLLWFNKNKDTILKCAQFPENYKDIRTEEVGKSYLSMCLPSLTRDHESSMVNRRKKPVRDLDMTELKKIVTSSSEHKDNVPKTVMFPVDPKIENILKEPLPEGGRKEYLKTRNELSPEEKYYFDATSNSVYGWRLKESSVPQRGPVFGRRNGFARELHSRVGPYPDPPHYNPPPKDPYCKC